MQQHHLTRLGVGVDVSKDYLDVCLLGPAVRRAWRTRNQAAAVDALVCELCELAPDRVVLESTGGYERMLARALARAAMPVVVMNPRQVRDFAKSEGLLAKTDRLDAYALALFASKSRPPLRPFASDEQHELRELTVALRKLIDDRAALQTQLRRTKLPVLEQSLLRRMEMLEAERRLLEAEIDARIANSTEWATRAALARTVPGVGPQVARTLLAELPELGSLPDRAVAALVGLAPFADDSGRRSGARFIRGGRKRVRRMLYMAAVSIARTDPRMSRFYLGLLQRGKPKKLALVAVARKLLVILNHIFAARSPWISWPA